MPEFMHVPENNDESSPPALTDNTSQSDEIMVSFSKDNVGCLCILVVADAFSLFFIIIFFLFFFIRYLLFIFLN